MIINQGYNHIEICKQALIDENLFNTFKSNNKYRIILEHVGYETGLEYLNKIKSNKDYSIIEKCWTKFLENDVIGTPIKFKYNLSDNLINTNVSPTTLRYISIGLDIIKYIQEKKLNNINICEIGGGYGGQSKILFDLCNIFNINIIKYKIIDIPEVSKFQEKYLTKLNIKNVTFESCLSINIEEHDLLISNYALGEFNNETQEEYIEKVVKYCKYYYMIWNNHGINEYFKDAIILPEIPETAEFNKVICK